MRAQLLAEPAPDLASRTIARLTDGTPLVTRASLGQGQLVLFHTTANAEWSNLAISGLFVEMLDRLVRSARVNRPAAPETDQAEQPFWTPELVLDGFGRVTEAEASAPVAAADFARGPAPGAPAGLYRGGERLKALNAGGPIRPANWHGARIERGTETPGLALRGWLIALAAALLRWMRWAAPGWRAAGKGHWHETVAAFFAADPMGDGSFRAGRARSKAGPSRRRGCAGLCHHRRCRS
ncbi:hypothetical protein ACFSS8_03250 [Paracoccus kondratievae]